MPSLITSTVALCHFLDFFLFPQCVAALCLALLTVYDFVCQTFSYCLLCLKCSVSSSNRQQVNCLVHSSYGRHINGLLPYSTSTSNPSWVFSWTGNLDGFKEDFERVFACQEVNNLESVSNNANGFDFLSGVSAGELHRSNESFDDGAQCLSEFFNLISSSSVWNEYLRSWWFACDVINEAGIFDLNLIIRPLRKEFGGVFEWDFGWTFLHKFDSWFRHLNGDKNIWIK